MGRRPSIPSVDGPARHPTTGGHHDQHPAPRRRRRRSTTSRLPYVALILGILSVPGSILDLGLQPAGRGLRLGPAGRRLLAVVLGIVALRGQRRRPLGIDHRDRARRRDGGDGRSSGPSPASDVAGPRAARTPEGGGPSAYPERVSPEPAGEVPSLESLHALGARQQPAYADRAAHDAAIAEAAHHAAAGLRGRVRRAEGQAGRRRYGARPSCSRAATAPRPSRASPPTTSATSCGCCSRWRSC